MLVSFALLSAASASLSFSGEPAGQPNIVFIMVDDMGWADLSSYGSKVIDTPNIDTLARDGVKFMQMYSASTVCAPARSSLMDGKHQGRSSVRLNTGGVPLLDEDYTLAEMMNDAGYRVGGFGKWGVGELGTDGVPEKQGFDVFYGYYHQIHAHYFLPDYLIRNSVKEPLPGNEGFYKKYPHGLAGDGGFPRIDEGLTRQFAGDLVYEETLNFIRESAERDEPFFCYAPWTPPHGEYKIPEDDPAWQKYKDKDWPVRARVVAAYDTMLDRQVGGLLDLLEELDIEDETIVFFLSDHGGDNDYDGILDSCGPLRGQKRSMYEGGLRVPMLVRWPDHIPAGTETDHLAYFPDVMATFASIAGVETPAGTDGISFLPAMQGSATQVAHDYLYWEWGAYNWGKGELVPGGLMQAIRIGPWKGVKKNQATPLELYYLPHDIGERDDLAAKYPNVVSRMKKAMGEAHEPMREQAEPPRVGGRAYR